MRSININVTPKKEGMKVPIDVAANVMIDIQSLFRHIGEYVLSRELKLQNRIDHRLSDMFDLFIDPSSGVSMRSSTNISTSGVIDEALTLLERTLISMGSGAGGYWIDDTYADPRFRKIIADDITSLASCLSDGYYIKFSADNLFDGMNLDKIERYVKELKMTIDDVTCGVIRILPSRSKRTGGIKLEIGDERIRMSFTNAESEKEAYGLADKAVIAAGKIRFSDGRITEISDVGKTIPFDNVKFKRMISAEGDVSLNVPLEVSVYYDNEKREWSLKNDDLGINVSKKDWDSAVTSFHDYFIFLWNEYTGKKDDELSDEEKEVKAALLGLVVT